MPVEKLNNLAQPDEKQSIPLPPLCKEGKKSHSLSHSVISFGNLESRLPTAARLESN